LEKPPWKNFVLPFHPSRREDLADLPNEPVELVFDLLGTAIVIDRGHRIRVTVAGADQANHARYPRGKKKNAPTISIHRDSAHSSYIELPMSKAD
jgi:predicted acyl esterase